MKEKNIIIECRPMPLVSSSFSLGCAKTYTENIYGNNAEAYADIAVAEYAYFSGDAEGAAEKSLAHLLDDDINVSLSALFIYAYANLTLGNIQRSYFALSEIRRYCSEDKKKNLSNEAEAFAVFVITAAHVLLHLPIPEDIPALSSMIKYLKGGLRSFAFYIMAHNEYLKKEYGKSLGIVESAFAIEEVQYPIPDIYLHLVAVMSSMGLENKEMAREHFMAAWELARPDGLIQPIGEHHGLTYGMTESCLKKDYPKELEAIISITYRFSAGWRKVHNPETGAEVADNLTTTEFSIAMLASRGWSNENIASHLGLSSNTVRNYLSVAYNKLGINDRKELIKYMLS